MTTNLLKALSDNIKIDMQKCIFCGECVERCILDNIRMRLAPCRQACPLGVNAQAYVTLIARGREDKAREMLGRDLPFPAIIGRICDAPCEKNCHRGKVTGQPVAIRALKRFLHETIPAAVPTPAPDSGKHAAVIGSGPAGMMAAFDLAVKGHRVTLLEAEARAGGMLRWAIPAFRLPEDVLDRELGILDQLGVRIQYGTRINDAADLLALEEKFDAVVVAAGQGGDRRLGVEGEELEGVYTALDFLRQAKEGRAARLQGRVVVIGGGNAAVDTAQVALRLGAEKVTIVSLEALGELPAFSHEVAQAQAEGVSFECSWGPVRIGGRGGRVVQVELLRCLSVLDEEGRFNPCFDSCQMTTMEADTVVVAIGQGGNTVATGLTADPVTLQTRRPKVFLAGDCHSGPSSVIRAMASGRQAAISVDRLFQGEHLRFNRSYAGPVVKEFDIDLAGAVARNRIDPPLRRMKGVGDFGEIEGAFSPEQARQEAERCYSCGRPEGYHRTCWFCLPCEVVCPEEALWVEIPYLLR